MGVWGLFFFVIPYPAKDNERAYQRAASLLFHLVLTTAFAGIYQLSYWVVTSKTSGPYWGMSKWTVHERTCLLGAHTFTSLVQQSCPWPSSPYPAQCPPAPVDGTGRRKAMRRNTAKLLALLPHPCSGGWLTTCILPQGRPVMAGKTPWMARPQPAREEDAQERHSFAAAESKDTTAAEEPRRSFCVWLKAVILLPEATAFLCLCPKPILFTQEMQLAASPIQQLFEYHFLTVASTWWLSTHFINFYLVFKLAGFVSWSA